jgi:hypothetical protein
MPKTQNQDFSKNAKNRSPYQVLTSWLVTPQTETTLDDWVIKSINPSMVLSMFSRLGPVTVFINEQFNNFVLYKLDKYEFFQFMKEVTSLKQLSRYDFTYLKYHKEDKSMDDLHIKFPTLKKHELIQLVELTKKDKTYDDIIYSMNLSKEKSKKKKLTKKDMS